MFFQAIAIASVAALAFSSPASAAPKHMAGEATLGLSLTAQLQLADTAADRYPLLPNNEDWVYDFSKKPFSVANRKTFPALVGSGISLTTGFLAACSMASLHIHPRSSEIFVVLQGKLITEMIPEAGVLGADGKPRLIRTELSANQTTLFPQGSFHTQLNPYCEPAMAVAAFPSEDAGAAIVVPEVFTLTDEFIANSFGGAISADDIAHIKKAVPQGATFDVEECRKKCNL